MRGRPPAPSSAVPAFVPRRAAAALRTNRLTTRRAAPWHRRWPRTRRRPGQVVPPSLLSLLVRQRGGSAAAGGGGQEQQQQGGGAALLPSSRRSGRASASASWSRTRTALLLADNHWSALTRLISFFTHPPLLCLSAAPRCAGSPQGCSRPILPPAPTPLQLQRRLLQRRQLLQTPRHHQGAVKPPLRQRRCRCGQSRRRRLQRPAS